MYNRYIPQPDGTYRRNKMQEAARAPEKTIPPPPSPPPLPIPPREAESAHCSSCIHNRPPRRPGPPAEPRRRENTSISGFLKQLLPKEFDTEDLLVVLLLLLIAGDNQDHQNSALLTLILYLFL